MARIGKFRGKFAAIQLVPQGVSSAISARVFQRFPARFEESDQCQPADVQHFCGLLGGVPLMRLGDRGDLAVSDGVHDVSEYLEDFGRQRDVFTVEGFPMSHDIAYVSAGGLELQTVRCW